MKIYQGKVISVTMQKTAKVLVERFIAHPVYKKRIIRSKKYHVHDTFGVKEGQVVRFVDSKPYSKTKKWRITEVLGEKKADSVKNIKDIKKSFEKERRTKSRVIRK